MPTPIGFILIYDPLSDLFWVADRHAAYAQAYQAKMVIKPQFRF